MPEAVKAILNKLFLIIIIGGTVLIPTYIGVTAGFTLGHRYLTKLQNQQPASLFTYVQSASNPMGIVKGYRDLNKMVVAYKAYPQYRQAYFNAAFDAKFYGPVIGGFLLGLFTLFLMRAPLMDFRPYRKKEKIHGDARWSTEADLKRAKLRAKKGLLMGRTGTANYLIADDFQHVLLFAPTGSGKGVGFVIPNLLFWEESVICHDIKLENYELTSGYRNKKLGQPCYVWNPADPNGVSHCYNPLDWISDKPGQMVDDVQKGAKCGE
jgi:type IV secretory pathway TraG/TraD family ATPase VirD4